MSKETALLVIDVQVGVVDWSEPAEEKGRVLARINDLLARARASNAPVIYVQHDGYEGGPLSVGSPGWEIHPAIAPADGETVIRKRAADAFHETPLKAKLEALGIKHLVVTGCRTQYCVDTTVRQATTLGYDVTLARDAHTTVDNEALTAAQIIAHHNETLDDFGTDEHVSLVKESSEISFD
ncbi:MAG TPA: cysteine hydrolase family protein [Pyrinomonadaceae bacterium]|jgi:nicotinamidase-related amidase